MNSLNPLPSIYELGLVDAPQHEDFDHLTRLAAKVFNNAIVLLAIVEPEKDRQFFTSAQGLPEPWATSRETPLSHSFCKYVKGSNAPLAINDARTHPLVHANGAINDLGVIAYLGAPIYGPGDAPIGALCVIEKMPRVWSQDDIEAVMDLAAAVTSKIQLRALLWERDQTLYQSSRLGLTVERAGYEVLVYDAQDLRYQVVNAGARQNLGFTIEELKTMTPLDIKPQYNKAKFEALIAPLRDQTASFLEYETIHRRKDGSEYLASVRLELHQDYDAPSFVAFCKDITERRRLEDAFGEALKAMPGRFMMFDPFDRLVFANNSEFAPTIKLNENWTPGMSLESIVKQLAYSRLIEDANDDPAAWAAEQMAKFDEGQGTSYRHVDGRFFEVRQSAARDGGKILLTLDVTTREQVRSEADAANQAKSVFLTGMSHELRTPLNAVIGFGQLLELDRTHTLTQDQMEYAQYIVKSGHHLLTLVCEVLDLAGIEAGHLKLSVEPINVQSLIVDLLTIMGPVASKAGITLTFEATDWRPIIRADVQRFRQVLLNFVSNAIKYNSPNGSVTLRLVDYEGRARVEVRDTGFGIDETLWPKVFTPFDRLGHDNSAIEGVGIGLALSKRLVEAMNGVIGFESSVGVGSTFWIDLPLSEFASDTSLEASWRELADMRPVIGGYSLLYVEDNPSNLRLMEHLVATQSNVQMYSAPSGELGLDLAQAHRPDVIVLDLNLLGMSGFDILRHLKSFPETKNTPVIALTAASMPNDIKRGLAAGFFRYITKPLDVNEFMTAIEDALSNSRKGKDIPS